MKSRPILFSTPMVRAILDGSKTMTRRIMKGKFEFGLCLSENGIITNCPHGKIDNLLWVRETWSLWLNDEGADGFKRCIKFSADDSIFIVPEEFFDWWDEKEKRGYLNRPSIFMPKWASRIWLKVTDIRAERLQDITWQDCVKEGISYITKPGQPNNFIDAFQTLWDSINGKPRKDGKDISWAANPWVFRVEFERVK